ncbi:hypothetical protein EZV62_001066 [Acer yangbiense]|uniref:DUF4283 domain-containing protein n=1 Tax=Acer yangbiense TaxID=1000413 RepID=A0A5C7IT16_9ROSI|nr:hypothetical protein EZV62_001066 [Acer yangbiense]
MGMEEIVNFYATMSLKEREGPVRRLRDGLKVEGGKKMALCLAGKILSQDLVNRDVFRSVISKIWRVRGEMEIEVLDSNTYAFHFQFPDDRRKILASGSWSFDDSLIVLMEPIGKRDLKSLKFCKAKFWIQISNIPILCMTKEIGRFLGSIVGEVGEVDTGSSGDCLGDGEETVMPIQWGGKPLNGKVNGIDRPNDLVEEVRRYRQRNVVPEKSNAGKRVELANEISWKGIVDSGANLGGISNFNLGVDSSCDSRDRSK